MKIVVAVKRVIDYKASVRIKADGSNVDLTNIKMAMNPFDEIAVEEAIRLKEQGIASEIIVVTIGNDNCQETLRTALAMGADRALLVKCEEEVQPLAVAKILSEVIKQEKPQILLLGKQAIDSDDNQVGQMLAGLVNWPQGTFASKLHFHDQGVSVTREIDGGLETVFLQLPAVITTDLRLNQPRYISLPNIVQAKRKPLNIIEVTSLPVTITPSINLLKVATPNKQKQCKFVDNATDLVARLKQDAQVI